MILGWRGASCSYSRPSSAASPGRMLASTTSARASSASRMVRASRWRRSSGSECLPRLRIRKWRLSPPPSGAMWRLGSPSSGSILTTCAPPSASTCPAHGTAMKWPNSSTVTPANGCAFGSVIGSPRRRAARLPLPCQRVGHPPFVPARIAAVREGRARHLRVGNEPVLQQTSLPRVDLVRRVARLHVALAGDGLGHVHGVDRGPARVELPQGLGRGPARGVEAVHQPDDVVLHALETP